MEKFTQLIAQACPIDIVNLNTDALLPARFLKLPRSAGLGKFLLHDLRYDAQGGERPDFPLHRPAWREARILAAEEGLSVSALLAAKLDEIVRQRKGYDRARKRAVARLRKGLNLGWTRPGSRDELHER